MLVAAAAADEVVVAPGWTAPVVAGYSAGIDPVAHTGNHGVALRATGAGAGDFFVRQRVKADRWRGKKIRVAGWLKLDQAEGGAALWLRVDMSNGDYVLDGALELTRRPGWTRAELVAFVPDDAAGISFGVRMKGGGVVWADDLSLAEAPAAARTTTIERRKNPKGLGDVYRDAKADPVNMGFELK
jgi:hypothetical protein